jgi:hypothetical protein
MKKPKQPRPLSSHLREDIYKIATWVSEQTDVSLSAMLSGNRRREIITARHALIYLAHKHLKTATLCNIGEFIGRDHSTIIHAKEAVQDSLDLPWDNRYTFVKKYLPENQASPFEILTNYFEKHYSIVINEQDFNAIADVMF